MSTAGLGELYVKLNFVILCKVGNRFLGNFCYFQIIKTVLKLYKDSFIIHELQIIPNSATK